MRESHRTVLEYMIKGLAMKGLTMFLKDFSKDTCFLCFYCFCVVYGSVGAIKKLAGNTTGYKTLSTGLK